MIILIIATIVIISGACSVDLAPNPHQRHHHQPHCQHHHQHHVFHVQIMMIISGARSVDLAPALTDPDGGQGSQES